MFDLARCELRYYDVFDVGTQLSGVNAKRFQSKPMKPIKIGHKYRIRFNLEN